MQERWTTPTQHKWLMGQMGDYLRAQDQPKSTRSVELFNNTIRALFLSKWSEELEKSERAELAEAAKIEAEASKDVKNGDGSKSRKKSKGKGKEKKVATPEEFKSREEWEETRCKVSLKAR